MSDWYQQAVWGSSPADVFAVGSGGLILHSDGASWEPIASGTTHTLRAVAGTGRGDVFAGDAAGTLLHFDGRAWAPLRATTSAELRGLAVLAGAVLLVGAESGVAHLSALGRNAFATCQPATLVGCGSSINAHNGQGDTALHRHGCAAREIVGPEAHFRFVSPRTGLVRVEVKNLAADLDLVVTGNGSPSSCDVGTCIGASTSSGVTPELVEFPAAAGATYYFTVDGYGWATSWFNLQVSCP